MEEAPEYPERYLAKGLVSDPTPDGFINQRFLASLFRLVLKLGDLTSQERDELLPILCMVTNKLGAVWYHRRLYREAEDRRLAVARVEPILEGQQQIRIPCVPELYYEFDAFLVQTKSCLDHLVQVPRSFIGRGWNLATFGSKGEDVRRALRRNVSPRLWPKAGAILRLLDDSAEWLRETIDARDRINHLKAGGIHPELFTVYVVENNVESTETVPMWSPSMTIRMFMDVSWQNLFSFCEEFVGLCLCLRLRPEWGLVKGPREFGDITSPWAPVSHEQMMEWVENHPGWTRFEPPPQAERKVGPNELCPCGSGKKYKKCCRPR